jgi:L-alanine-DL-glutamate epimerase-like enolase superfamily enzyme
MPRRVRLSRVALRYAGGAVLYTATSGPVPMLDELRLTVRQDGALAGLGATRVNIQYLSGIAPDLLVSEALLLGTAIDWRAPPAAWVEAAEAAHAPVRMLFEMAARDAEARDAGVPLSTALGGAAAGTATPTNQTLFWCDDETLAARARAFAARGFLDQKLRVGVGSADNDLSRFALLRTVLGADATLSVDANGRWDVATARRFIEAAAPLGLSCCEQPLPPESREGLAALATASAVPIMLDESLDSMRAVAWLAATRAAPQAHVKLAKLGGLDRLVAAARTLQAAGIGVMVGQMNEGVPSTLAAAHAAIAVGAAWRELYGADGLENDPAGRLRYADGLLHLPPGPGLGIADCAEHGDTLLEITA